MKKLKISSVLLFLLSVNLCFGQKVEFKQYINKHHKFCFNVPKTWKIFFSNHEESIICVATTAKEKSKYADCFEGIIFRMQIYNFGLDSFLDKEGYYKDGNEYYTSDRSHDSVKTKHINGKNWRGIYHKNICGINCNSNGFHAAAGECEFLFFSHKEKTICITTNGRAFDEKVLKTLLKSFRFMN